MTAEGTRTGWGELRDAALSGGLGLQTDAREASPLSRRLVLPEGGGLYYLWARMQGPDERSDSFSLDINGRPLGGGNFGQTTGERWEWVPISTGAADSVELPSGELVFTLRPRERGARIDAFFLTNRPTYRPENGGDVGLVVAVETGDELHWLDPERGEARLMVVNTGERPAAGSLTWGVRTRSDVPAERPHEKRFTLAPGEQLAIDATAALGRAPGPRYIDWQLRVDGRPAAAAGVQSVAVMRPVGPAPSRPGAFVLGGTGPNIRAHVPEDLQRRHLRIGALVGMNSARTGGEWRYIQPEPDVWRFEGLDRVVDLAEQHGQEIQFLLAYGGAEWARAEAHRETARAMLEARNTRTWRLPPRLDAWRAMVRKYAERYQGRIRLWEVWNEPDIGFFQGSAEEYLGLLRVSHEELKAVSPDNIVLTGGFAGLNHPRHKADIVQVTLKEGRNYWDYFTWHFHADFRTFQENVDRRLLPLMREHGIEDRPLYFNESAIGRPFELEREQAAILAKRVPFAWARGAVGYHWFVNHVRWKDARASLWNYRMFNPDFTPRAVVPAFNTLSRALRGREFATELAGSDGLWAFAFRGKGDFSGETENDLALVGWHEDANRHEARLVRVGAGARAELWDLMGAVQEVPVRDGLALWPIHGEPTYLLISGGDGRVEFADAFLSPGTVAGVSPGGVADIRIRLKNPLQDEVEVLLAWQPQAPLRATGAPELRVKLAAGEAREVPFQVALPADAVVSNGEGVVRVSATMTAGGFSAEAVQPVLLTRTLPGTPAAGRAPDFVLDQAAQVVNRNDIDPATHHLSWQGPDDLSARAWLSLDADAWEMRFEVRDDVHRQPHAGHHLWKGDSVQIAWTVPGQTGLWEMGLARREPGGDTVYFWSVPDGFDLAAVSAAARLRTVREAGVTHYQVRLPRAAFGLSREALSGPLRFSFLVQDLDAPGNAEREGYIQLSEGIAERKDPRAFPAILLREGGTGANTSR